jgi:hypothetical protein
VRAFRVKLPSAERYWTIVDDEYRIVADVDEYLRHLRFGQDVAESTTKAYAESLALYLRCARGLSGTGEPPPKGSARSSPGLSTPQRRTTTTVALGADAQMSERSGPTPVADKLRQAATGKPPAAKLTLRSQVGNFTDCLCASVMFD